ncbi:MAG: hypothetical protein ACRDM2_03815 [Gaiellaceae bacterium]
MFAEFTFWEQLLLNVVGPVFTVLIGTLLVGLVVARVTRKAQERREDHALRERLVGEVTETATSLYLATQHYWRAKKSGLSGDALAHVREALDRRYLEARQSGFVLERLLELHFVGVGPRSLMHRVMDLLTVRYFQLTEEGGASLKLREANAGKEHSGLSVDQLALPKEVLNQYNVSLGALIAAVSRTPLRIPSEGGAPT